MLKESELLGLAQAFGRAKQREANAALVASDALHAVCLAVSRGDTSVRRAATLLGLPKSTLARLSAKAAAGEWIPSDISRLSEAEFCAAFEASWGVPRPGGAPFRVAVAGDERTFEWCD